LLDQQNGAVPVILVEEEGALTVRSGQFKRVGDLSALV
jgi:hypothetical protein